jgi:hypothetical protein
VGVRVLSQTRIRKAAYELMVPYIGMPQDMNMRNIAETSFSVTATPLEMLSSVSFEKGFHFFLDHESYTGITAISLFEFVEKLEIVNIRSVEYHFRRHDFQRWINDVIGDVELATRIASLNNKLSGETLRTQIIEVVQKRLNRLERLAGGMI